METTEETVNTKRTCRNRKQTWFLITTVILLLVAVGVLAYLFSQSKNDTRVVNNKLESSQYQVTDLERKIAKADAVKADQPVVDTDTSGPDSEVIVKVALAQARAFTDSENTDFKVTVDKLELPFARVGVGAEGAEAGGRYCVLKKVDDRWVQLYCSQGGVPDLEKQYGVPQSIIAS